MKRHKFLLTIALMLLAPSSCVGQAVQGDRNALPPVRAGAQRVLVLLHDVGQSGDALQGRLRQVAAAQGFDAAIAPSYDWRDAQVPEIAARLYSELQLAFPKAIFVLDGRGKGGLVARWIAERIIGAEGRVERVVTTETPNGGMDIRQLSQRLHLDGVQALPRGIAELAPGSETLKALSAPPVNDVRGVYAVSIHDLKHEPQVIQESAFSRLAASYGAYQFLSVSSDTAALHNRGDYVPVPQLLPARPEEQLLTIPDNDHLADTRQLKYPVLEQPAPVLTDKQSPRIPDVSLPDTSDQNLHVQPNPRAPIGLPIADEPNGETGATPQVSLVGAQVIAAQAQLESRQIAVKTAQEKIERDKQAIRRIDPKAIVGDIEDWMNVSNKAQQKLQDKLGEIAVDLFLENQTVLNEGQTKTIKIYVEIQRTWQKLDEAARSGDSEVKRQANLEVAETLAKVLPELLDSDPDPRLAAAVNTLEADLVSAEAAMSSVFANQRIEQSSNNAAQDDKSLKRLKVVMENHERDLKRAKQELEKAQRAVEAAQAKEEERAHNERVVDRINTPPDNPALSVPLASANTGSIMDRLADKAYSQGENLFATRPQTNVTGGGLFGFLLRLLQSIIDELTEDFPALTKW